MNTSFRCGWVAFIGAPNVGKSTMLNKIMGQKVAIVSPKPQTTRNQITGILSEEDCQIIFFDTPGIHGRRGKMNKFLLQTAWQSLQQSDVTVLILDSYQFINKPAAFDADLKRIIKPLLSIQPPMVICLNKADKISDKKRLLPLMEMIHGHFPDCVIIPTSAVTGDGLDKMLDEVKSRLPLSPPIYPEDQISTLPIRFMSSEIIREKLFLGLRQELPYQLAVDIEKWEEDEGLTRINAIIYVARNTHKSIVIGKGGSNLKRIGAQARQEIEELLENKVFLEMWVKVKTDWTENPHFLTEIGLGL